jgi:hypothetical protein
MHALFVMLCGVLTNGDEYTKEEKEEEKAE